MSRGRIFLHSEGCFVACLDQETGKPSWRNNAPELLVAISEPNDRGLGFKTTPYALATDRAVYFAGRGRKNVVAVSAEDGKFLWSIPGAYNATNLLFQGGHLYAHIPSCQMIEPLTGRIVKDLGIAKRSCARFTGCPDSLFHRGSITGGEGTTRYDLATGTPTVMHAIRPPCMDGHIPAQGFLYRTQWVCDCNLQLIGLISLCPAGDFEFNRQATESERLETSSGDLSAIAAFANSDRDWPTYRADNYRSSSTRTNVPGKVAKRWEFQPGVSFSPSPPTVAGGTIFLGGDDCKVRAIDVQTGKERWTFLTGGAVRMPPSIGNGRAFAGSADGYVYALEAATGRPLWRFRAAPVERKIPVYGSLSSTWPVNSGALVRDGTVYAAAGIVNFDGTHVYALDALTGKIKWQNNTSGYLNEDLREGASVQGDLAVVGEKLLLAGGNVLSPAVYNLSDGKCLNSPPGRGHPAAHRGSEVCGFLGKYAMVGGRRLFTPDDDPITNWQPYDVFYPDNLAAKLTTEFKGRVPPAFGNGVVAFSDRGPLLCLDADKMDEWIRKERPGVKERWKTNSVVNSVSVAVAGNAIVAAGEVGRGARSPSGWSVQAFAIESGDLLWAEPLPRPALPGGLCVDKDGRMIVVLEGGNVLCLGEAESR
jgi:outer membrane protein assembly factor BamB